MKNKKHLLLLSILVGLMVFCTGIWTSAKQIQSNQALHSQKNSEEYDPLTFEEYMEEDINLLNEKEKIQLKSLYDQVIEKDKKEDFDESNKLWDEFCNELRKTKVPVIDRDLKDFIEAHKGEFTQKDYENINKLYEKTEKYEDYLDQLSEEETEEIEKTEERIDQIWDEIEKILTPMGYDLDEIMDHIYNENIFIALYNIKHNQIQYKPINKHKINELSSEDISNHKILWNEAKKIFPPEYLNRIINFEINTDGRDGILAHVIEADDISKTWRLALDIKDSIYKNGTFKEGLHHTLVHELCHIITLNDTQLTDEFNEDDPTYTTDEIILTKDSYLNQFYNEFWTNIYEEWQIANEPKENERGQDKALEAFYEKYKSQFVSEYATTSPEEDIADSFMEFVMNDQPKGNTIAEKKMLFFYNFEELVKIREKIRSRLF
ncbi:hypothetical protein [Inediibacterium massiliense]|uniref:hypothetical protein n=1 Tax=Inediibacterium massiliense TaxID=1658111 RepID=UPI0006B4B4BA|nr:hypothetical protein [Inediibacterium massiliense]